MKLGSCSIALALAASACPGLESESPDASSGAEASAALLPPDSSAADTSTADAGAPARTAYTLDLTAVRESSPAAPGGEWVGIPVFSHNSHALFAIDLGTTSKRVERLSWDTVVELQGKATCDGFPDQRAAEAVADSPDGGAGDRAYVPDGERGDQALKWYAPDDALKGFRSPHRVHLRGLDLQMPYRVPSDGFVRVAGAICLAVRTGDGVWRWRNRRFLPVQDAAAERATAHLDLDVDDVDAVAIRFEVSTPVAYIRYTIDSPAQPPLELPRGDLATAGCCAACAPAGADLASRYCCASQAPPPEPCIEEQSAISAQCQPRRHLYDWAAGTCRARSLWLRDYQLLDPDRVCVGPDGRSPTGARGVHFKCCRDAFFVPPPPDAPGPLSDCVLVGGLSMPCQSNAAMLEQQVASCFGSGLIHRRTIFGNECPGVGSSSVTSICCRPGVPGPPVTTCTM